MKTVILVLEQHIIDFKKMVATSNEDKRNEYYFIRGMLSALFIDNIINDESCSAYLSDLNNTYFGGMKNEK